MTGPDRPEAVRALERRSVGASERRGVGVSECRGGGGISMFSMAEVEFLDCLIFHVNC